MASMTRATNTRSDLKVWQFSHCMMMSTNTQIIATNTRSDKHLNVYSKKDSGHKYRVKQHVKAYASCTHWKCTCTSEKLLGNSLTWENNPDTFGLDRYAMYFIQCIMYTMYIIHCHCLIFLSAGEILRVSPCPSWGVWHHQRGTHQTWVHKQRVLFL